MAIDGLLAHAARIVRTGAEIARDGFGSSSLVREKERGDLVTEGDLAVEEHVLSRLRELYPEHGFYSEEAGKEREDAEYVWILDPIDGTKYYARGIPLYSISLALQRRGELILGVVFNPESEQMFSAAKGEGATLNGRPIQCSGVTRLDEAILCAEIPSRDFPLTQRKWALEKMAALIDRTRRLRVLGVGALGLCYSAMGGFDAYVNLGSGSRDYDVAAGRVILSEAGGLFTSVGDRIVAGPPSLCEQLLDLLELKSGP